jgi:hypothetical protein
LGAVFAWEERIGGGWAASPGGGRLPTGGLIEEESEAEPSVSRIEPVRRNGVEGLDGPDGTTGPVAGRGRLPERGSSVTRGTTGPVPAAGGG